MADRPVHLAARLGEIQPFRVMEILGKARAMEAAGRPVIHMEIGEPDFPTPDGIVRAGIVALEQGHTHYTPALGLPELRQAIADHYPAEARPDPSRVVVTPGGSGALQLILAALLNPGDELLIADPGYPCHRHFARLFEGRAVSVPVDAGSGFQLSAQSIREHWTPRTVAALVVSPSNPTGTVIADEELGAIVETVRELGGRLIVDEIYHGLTYGTRVRSVLAHADDVFVVNSFSKYYGMTGWRLGWLVAPEEYIDGIERLAQNIFIAAATPAQYAALHAFDQDVIAELEHRREIFRERRDYLVPALQDLGFRIPVVPEGAFYIYADCSEFGRDSETLVGEILEQTAVALTPGSDFGSFESGRYLRVSYATDLERLHEAVDRLRAWLSQASA
ncbi:MAG: pyridoxal phosphate-dependent aminotransferase [Acidiferrobacteraceae bacterium]|jgi:aspartate/methionine/tyrosine aminotransferase